MDDRDTADPEPVLRSTVGLHLHYTFSLYHSPRLVLQSCPRRHICNKSSSGQTRNLLL